MTPCPITTTRTTGSSSSARRGTGASTRPCADCERGGFPSLATRPELLARDGKPARTPTRTARRRRPGPEAKPRQHVEYPATVSAHHHRRPQRSHIERG